MSIKSVFDYANNLINKYKVTAEHVNNAVAWLNYYGYLVKTGDIKDYTLQEIIDGVKKFQDFYNLKVDGEIGTRTLTSMSWTRCGCKDLEREESREQLRGWAKNTLKIFVKKPLTGLTQEKQQSLIVNWLNEEINKVCNLTFVHGSNESEADIVIGCSSKPSDEFGVSGAVLAWCELPGSNYNGKILCMYDDAESWLLDPNSTSRGIILKNVTIHEILHGVGLSHSKYKCLMYPIYDRNVGSPIDPDDITQLQLRYGPAVTPPPPDPDEPENPPDPPLPPPTETSIITLEVQGIKKIDVPGWRITKMGD